MFMEFLLPLMILVFCYGRILWVLRRRMDSTLGREGGKDPSAATFQKAQKNVVKTLLLVVLFFVLCFTSAEVYYSMESFGFPIDYNTPFYKFTGVMMLVNCTVNPFIYLFNYDDFQMALKRSLCFKVSKHNSDDISSQHTVSSVSP